MNYKLTAAMTVTGIALSILVLGAVATSAGELLKPPAIWADYDPNKGDFKEELISKETKEGIFTKEFYISTYVLNEEIRVYCKYSVKEGLTNAPGLLNVRGWMSWPIINTPYVKDGWACMAFDYCGKPPERLPPRKHYTKYPERFSYGNHANPVHDKNRDGTSITDPKLTSEYLWYAIERRALSYLEQQKEVDKTRLGALGTSYGGTLMWALGTDPRIKAIVAHFGIGWIEYWRNKQVLMYNIPYVEPPKTPGEEIFLAGMSPEAYVPYITAPTLFLGGSSDHHGGHERGLESFKLFKPGMPWAYAIQARAGHDTKQTDQDTKMWLEKYVLNKEVFWPAHPKSEIKLDSEGVPELRVAPATPERIKRVEMYYSQKDPSNMTRKWRDIPAVKQGNLWVGKMAVRNVDDYVFGYANVIYDTTVVLSTDFNAAIPAKLGSAKATDKTSEASESKAAADHKGKKSNDE